MSGTLSMSSWICHEKRKLAVWILIPLSQKIFSLFFFCSVGKEGLYNAKNTNLLIWKSESLQHTRVLVGVALFMALDVLLGSLSINLTETLRISFTFLGVAASCYFLVCGQMFLPLFLVDLLGYLAHPVGPYMPLFALTAILNAVIYSVCFYGMQRSVSNASP